MPHPYFDEIESSVGEGDESPLHGYRGVLDAPSALDVPAGLTVAISREAGARGATIGARAGAKLGWNVYSQEMLEYGAQNPSVRTEMQEKLSPAALEWVEEQLAEMQAERHLSRHPNILDLARIVLSLGAQGNVVLLGRGAGFLLPARSTLHVRLVAPLSARIAYMSQWLRMTEEEAAVEVSKRDHRRAEFLTTHFRRQPNDIHQFDMLLNTSLLGEERCADLIAFAAAAKGDSHAAEIGSNG
jgi:cytidylate kinase